MENHFNYPTREKDSSDIWMPLSDLFVALAVLVLIISMAYIFIVVKERGEITQVATQLSEKTERIDTILDSYRAAKLAIYNDLNSEFADDFQTWGAAIDKDKLSISFQKPEALFAAGDDALSDNFQTILSDFFPRYIGIVTKYKSDVAEIRIEGHTDSSWGGGADEMESYLQNMRLSQGRTNSVLEYSIQLPDVQNNLAWVKSKVTANGLSSSQLVYKSDGSEDQALSRRVEFRIRTLAEEKINSLSQ